MAFKILPPLPLRLAHCQVGAALNRVFGCDQENIRELVISQPQELFAKVLEMEYPCHIKFSFSRLW